MLNDKIKAELKSLESADKMSNERIDALNNFSWQLIVTKPEVAANLSLRTLNYAVQADYLRGRAYSLRNLGWAHCVRDRFQPALNNLSESLKIFRNVSDCAGQASTENCLAAVEKKQGNYEKASLHYGKALHNFKKTKNSAGVASVFKNLAGIHTRTGDYLPALDYHYQALAAALKSNSIITAHVKCDLGDLLWRLEDYAGALKLLQESLVTYQENSDQINKSAALLNLGAVHLSLNQLTIAETYFRQGLDIADEFDSYESKIEALTGLGNVAAERNELRSAVNFHEQACSAAQSINSRFYLGESLLSLGIVYQKLGKHSESVATLFEAVRVSEQINAQATAYKIHLALSNEFHQRGEYALAFEHYQAYHRIWRRVASISVNSYLKRIQKSVLFARSGSLFDDQKLLAVHESPHIQNATLESPKLALPPLKLKEILSFIAAHLDENIETENLADIVNLSESHFRRAFKATTGLTPHQYLLRERINKAKKMLRNTKLPITEIAFECGFNSHSHLSTQFRLTVGSSPLDYRRSITAEDC